ncbi:MAG: flagellar hook assembly protein FlgD, partial [Planctomycetota bacterium]
IPFRDLAIQTRENDLVGATFGRGFYILDDYSALRHISARSLEQEMELFPVRDAWWYVQRRTLGGGQKASQGDAFFVAPNPAFGATFTYYLKESLKTRKDTRTQSEKEIADAGGDTPTPGWEALREEEIEETPAIVLTVRDADGNVVRHLAGPTEAGIHRVSWSLTYPSIDPWMPAEDLGEREVWETGGGDDGILVAPGVYTVHLASRVDGKLVDTGASQRFEVVPLRDGGTLPGAEPGEMVAFYRDFAETRRSVSGGGRVLEDAQERLGAIRETLDRSIVDGAELGDEVRSMERRLADMREMLWTNPRRAFANDQGPVTITARLGVVEEGTRDSLYGPTATHRESLDIARRQFEQLKAELDRLVQVELPALERRLDEAGVPWTPGRGVPGR